MKLASARALTVHFRQRLEQLVDVAAYLRFFRKRSGKPSTGTTLSSRALQVMQADFEPATWKACWEVVVNRRPAAEVEVRSTSAREAVYAAGFRVLDAAPRGTRGNAGLIRIVSRPRSAAPIQKMHGRTLSVRNPPVRQILTSTRDA